MEDDRIQKKKKILYGEFAPGQRTVGRPHLRFKDVWRRVMTALLDTSKWERIADGRMSWKNIRQQYLEKGRKLSGTWQSKREPDGSTNSPPQLQSRSTDVATVTETVTPIPT